MKKDHVKESNAIKTNMFMNIRVQDLVDNVEYGENADKTEELELSISENGFNDPLEVTDFGMEEGHYLIVSGHRRKNAGVKLGMESFPCIIWHFKDKNEMVNYTLMANSHRDSAKDPLLLAARYQLHRKYLKESGFRGSFHSEIAKRMGVSLAQVDRYAAMEKIVQPVLEMVGQGVVGVSSIHPLASHAKEEQMEIYHRMQEALKNGIPLTREFVSDLVRKYRKEKGHQRDTEINMDDELQILSKIVSNESDTEKSLKTEKDVGKSVTADNTAGNADPEEYTSSAETASHPAKEKSSDGQAARDNVQNIGNSVPDDELTYEELLSENQMLKKKLQIAEEEIRLLKESFMEKGCEPAITDEEKRFEFIECVCRAAADGSVSQKEATGVIADAFHVDNRYARHYLKVYKNGITQLIDAVKCPVYKPEHEGKVKETGKPIQRHIPVTFAAGIAALSPENQDLAVRRINAGGDTEAVIKVLKEWETLPQNA